MHQQVVLAEQIQKVTCKLLAYKKEYAEAQKSQQQLVKTLAYGGGLPCVAKVTLTEDASECEEKCNEQCQRTKKPKKNAVVQKVNQN